MPKILITGSSGLIGAEAVAFFDARSWRVDGVDNNMRRDFFGPDGDTKPTLDRLRATSRRFIHHDVDVRNREAMLRLVEELRPDLIVQLSPR